jgi:hypothetical protein
VARDAGVALRKAISSAALQARLIDQVEATREWARQHGVTPEHLDSLVDAHESAGR